MKKSYSIFFILLILALASILLMSLKRKDTSRVPASSIISVVAAENFYGDIVKQLGGDHVQVTSILSDPTVDPHEYESNVQDGIAVSNAAIVIENGDGYDTWMDKLLSASHNSGRVVLVGSTIANHKLEDNPHVWYGISNIKIIAQRITDTLKQKDIKDAAEFDRNLVTFDASLVSVEQKIDLIKENYGGNPIGLTETIYLYQTIPAGLNVITPIAFERAVAEGNDPSAQDVATANDQIINKQIKVLIYNKQTITPITINLENEAKKRNIPVVAVTETMPTHTHYQSWMEDQLTNLESALQSTK